MLHLRTTKNRKVKLHQATIAYFKDFPRDHLIKLRGTNQETRDFEERSIGINWWHGGYHSVSRDVEKVTFTPDHFSFNYKCATIFRSAQWRERRDAGAR